MAGATQEALLFFAARLLLVAAEAKHSAEAAVRSRAVVMWTSDRALRQRSSTFELSNQSRNYARLVVEIAKSSFLLSSSH